MMSLPFMYGFINTRWTRSIDVMLEKKRGNRKIHMLRIIGLLVQHRVKNNLCKENDE